ncbi:MAG: organic solvent tolerance protein OstA [Spirochaetaceae bacterium]|nr:organic solvent tolerance protein OstA [Spirochaetaceae bacterium]
MKKNIFLILLVLLVFSGGFCFSQEGSQAQTQEESSEEVIDFSAQKMSGSMKKDQDYTRLVGSAKIKTSSMEIQADVIELYGKDFRYIKAEGTVKGVQDEDGLTFSCQTMDYDREEKIAVFGGNVVLDDKENEVVAKAQRIEYREKEAIALMQVDVELTNEDSLSTCAFALYRKEEKLLEMTGNPQVVQGENTFRAQEIILNLDTDEITMDGRVQGTVTEEGDE